MKKVKNRQSDNAQPVFVLLMGSTQPREKNQGDGPHGPPRQTKN